MRQRLRSHLTYANVMVTILAFIVLGGMSYAATGGNFLLGKSNSAANTTSLSAPVSGKALQVTNTGTVASSTALGLNVAPGQPPFSVNSGTKVAGLNADKLDGVDSTGFLPSSNVKRLDYTATTTSITGPTAIATVGPYTIKGECVHDIGGGGAFVRIFVNGPAGTSDSVLSETSDDTPGGDTRTNELVIPSGSDFQIISAASTFSHFTHAGGTSMLRSGSVTVQVDFDMVADGRDSTTDHCSIFGTAMKAT